ncbi:MAG: hypothetical protein ACO3NW_04635 [Kiritimatiellia bacterium]
MTDESDPSSDSPPGESYRVCDACHCLIHHEQVCCPECGAFPGEDHSPTADKAVNLCLSAVLFVVLGLGLYALSQHRDEARRLEEEKFTRLRGASEGQSSPALPQPLPTPSPTPQPTPLPLPSPTPLPFRSDDFNPTPVPPRPTPRLPVVPLPPPTATPVPEPTRQSTLELRDQLTRQFLQDLDERFPMAKEGDSIRLVLLDNRSLSGEIARMEANQLALRSTAGIRWIPYRQLSRESRMRVDQSERETWAEEQALQEVLKRLQQ